VRIWRNSRRTGHQSLNRIAVIFAIATTELPCQNFRVSHSPRNPHSSGSSYALPTLPMNGFANHRLDESAFGEKKTFTDGLRTFDAFRKCRRNLLYV